MKSSFQNTPSTARGMGAVAGGGTGFFLSRSIAFTRVASRTPGEGSFLGRKQLGQRKAANLPPGNREQEEVAQEPDSEAGKPKVDARREVQSPASLEMHRSQVAFLPNSLVSHRAGGFTSYFPSCLPLTSKPGWHF